MGRMLRTSRSYSSLPAEHRRPWNTTRRPLLFTRRVRIRIRVARVEELKGHIRQLIVPNALPSTETVPTPAVAIGLSVAVQRPIRLPSWLRR
jgi:hypothetical protein